MLITDADDDFYILKTAREVAGKLHEVAFAN